jgi:hypothetical protein
MGTSTSSFKLPAASGATDTHGKPQKILFQKFMFDDFVALTAAYFVKEIFLSVLVFYFQYNLILAHFQQIQLTASHIIIPTYFLQSSAVALPPAIFRREGRP